MQSPNPRDSQVSLFKLILGEKASRPFSQKQDTKFHFEKVLFMCQPPKNTHRLHI